MARSATSSLQETFSVADDVAEMLCDEPDEPLDVNASGASLGVLMELLLLKRAARTKVTIADSSARGQLFRELLSGGQVFRCKGGLGLYNAKSKHVDSAGEASDFCGEARAVLKLAGMPDTASLRLSGALHELLSNVDEHAGADATCLAGFEVEDGAASLCVADTGAGVLAGFQSGGAIVVPRSATQALQWAVLEHRSRTGLPGRGTGFQTVVNAFRTLDASMRVRSDDASLELVQQGSDADSLLRKQGQLGGFVVSVQLRWRKS
jgi:hypothetical protein